MITKVECDQCGRKVNVGSDGRYYVHGWTQFGEKHRCANSQQPYAFHLGSFRFLRKLQMWCCECRCGEEFVGSEYDIVEADWEQHVKDVKL